LCGCPLLLAAALLFGASVCSSAAEPPAPDFIPAARRERARPEPVPIIRFRCEVAPDANTCAEAPPQQESEVCNCDKDFCYAGRSGGRICEKS
jgi:hypothetical protein